MFFKKSDDESHLCANSVAVVQMWAFWVSLSDKFHAVKSQCGDSKQQAAQSDGMFSNQAID